MRLYILFFSAVLLLAACESSTEEKSEAQPQFPEKPRFAGFRDSAMVVFDDATRNVFVYKNQAFSFQNHLTEDLLWESAQGSITSARRDSAHSITLALPDGTKKTFSYDGPISKAIFSHGYIYANSPTGVAWKTDVKTGKTINFNDPKRSRMYFIADFKNAVYTAMTELGTEKERTYLVFYDGTPNETNGMAKNISGFSVIPSQKGNYWTDDLPGAGDSLLIFNASLGRYKKRAKGAGTFNFVYEYPKHSAHEFVSYDPDSKQLNITYFEQKSYTLLSLDPDEKFIILQNGQRKSVTQSELNKLQLKE